jgi:predicted dienelactone hydrolase
VRLVGNLELPHRVRDELLQFKVYYPEAGRNGSAPGQWPILIFSHGNWSDNDKYDNVLRHWVSHGYVVLAPLHRDGSGGYLGGTIDLLREGNLGLIQGRVDDLLTLLDSIRQVEQLVPALAGRLDHDRIAATGHSFGAFNAQQLGGARAWDENGQEFVAVRDERISAVVALSPPGPMFDEITEGSWEQQGTPALVTTGTWDSNAMFWPDWRAHLMSWETAVAGDQYALVVQGADHYLGNLICRPELEEPPQHDALAMVNSAVVTFLDARLKGKQQAVAALHSNQLARTTRGFAVLERR